MNQMQYRKLPHGEEQISILGLGTSSIQAADERQIEDTIRYAGGTYGWTIDLDEIKRSIEWQ